MVSDSREIIRKTEERLKTDYQTEITRANAVQLHNAVSGVIMDMISDTWAQSQRLHGNERRAFYFSAEYLIGRAVYNNLFDLGVLDEVRCLLCEKGADIAMLEDIEDAALGNGGLGRLAACFLESAATKGIPLDGYGLRYKAGLFKQSFSNGMQVEEADDWQKGGDPWSIRRDDRTAVVEFAGLKAAAVPYDTPILGYKTGNISTLRLWQSEPAREFDFSPEHGPALQGENEAENITGALYPDDSTEKGKRLRLRQEYFLCSASLQDIIRTYKENHENSLEGFSEYCAIQINDTHPAIAIPEMIRLLMKEGVGFDSSFETAKSIFSYTNHTVMREALEKWELCLLKSEVPQIADIVLKIDEKLAAELENTGCTEEEAKSMRIVDSDGYVHMAVLAVYASSYVNGVAKIHTEILKSKLFNESYRRWPDKFKSITNGVTQRRWLGLCNPELTEMIQEHIGDGFLTDLSKIGELRSHINSDTIDAFNNIKRVKKEQLADIIKQREGIAVSPDFIFDVQVKRMHEYKRQLLNAFSVLDIYYALKDKTLKNFTPTVFIFGAKAAPGYIRAKAIMKFINEIAKLVNEDPGMKELMKVVFVQNYDCSYAEHIIPAADISEQISTAGTEASGTGNMKLMLNGAVTLGTYDGANIEIAEQAGEENNYIFGARVEDIDRIKSAYDPLALYNADPRIRRAVDALIDGIADDGGTGLFKDIYESLLSETGRHNPDRFFLLFDMIPYFKAKQQANEDYRDRLLFGRKCLENIASAGNFSSDRAIEQYAREIWHVV